MVSTDIFIYIPDYTIYQNWFIQATVMHQLVQEIDLIHCQIVINGKMDQYFNYPRSDSIFATSMMIIDC